MEGRGKMREGVVRQWKTGAGQNKKDKTKREKALERGESEGASKERGSRELRGRARRQPAASAFAIMTRGTVGLVTVRLG